jgi:hypothetical protein
MIFLFFSSNSENEVEMIDKFLVLRLLDAEYEGVDEFE